MVASKLHCLYCFDVLATHLDGDDPHALPVPFNANTNANANAAAAASGEPTKPPQAYPLFVTWTKSAALRGCIGNFTPQPLARGLRDYALIAALQDHRFAPITKSELGKLHCGVSLLTDFEPCTHALDWHVGTHGVRVTFACPATGRALGATFLPEVAHDQGWDHAQTIRQLVRKAGWTGPLDRVVDLARARAGRDTLGFKVVRYQSRKATCTYAEYVAWVQGGRKVDEEEQDEEEEEDVSSSA